MRSCTISDEDALCGHQQPSKHMPAQLSIMSQRVHQAGTRQNQKCWKEVGIMLGGNGSKTEDIGKISKGDDQKGLIKLNQLQVGCVFAFYFILTRRTSELSRPRVVCITSIS